MATAGESSDFRKYEVVLNTVFGAAVGVIGVSGSANGLHNVKAFCLTLAFYVLTALCAIWIVVATSAFADRISRRARFDRSSAIVYVLVSAMLIAALWTFSAWSSNWAVLPAADVICVLIAWTISYIMVAVWVRWAMIQ